MNLLVNADTSLWLTAFAQPSKNMIQHFPSEIISSVHWPEIIIIIIIIIQTEGCCDSILCLDRERLCTLITLSSPSHCCKSFKSNDAINESWLLIYNLAKCPAILKEQSRSFRHRRSFYSLFYKFHSFALENWRSGNLKTGRWRTS